MNKVDVLLYLVTDSEGMTHEQFVDKVEKALRSGVTLLQLREKNKTGREFYHEALAVKKLADKYNVPLIINDRIDIALAVDAAGVHVGQSDIPVAQARRLLGADKIVGATTKTLEQAAQAVQEGADYLGVGAMFPTTTKVITVPTSKATLCEICEAVDIPVVAIGGINIDNIGTLAGCPIDGVAVVSAIMKAQDAAKATAELLAASRRVADHE